MLGVWIGRGDCYGLIPKSVFAAFFFRMGRRDIGMFTCSVDLVGWGFVLTPGVTPGGIRGASIISYWSLTFHLGP